MLFLSLILLQGSGVRAQRAIEVKFQQDDKGAYVFTAYNHAFCDYTISISFPLFNNVRSDRPVPFLTEIKPGMNKLFTLSAINKAEAVKFNYSTSNHRGCMHPVADTSIIYLLPIGPGIEAQAYEMSNQTGGEANWYGIRLKMKPGDTIYAARRGVVAEVVDGDSSNDAGLASAGHENYIEIVHADCTFGHYGILKRGGALVNPGQLVKAGQPIGLVGGDRYGRGSEVRLSVYYNEETGGAANQGNELKTEMRYVLFPCWTKNSGRTQIKHGVVYSSAFPSAIVNREEPKKLPLGKGKKKK